MADHAAKDVQDPAEQYEASTHVEVTTEESFVDDEQLPAHHDEDDNPTSHAGETVEVDEN